MKDSANFQESAKEEVSPNSIGSNVASEMVGRRDGTVADAFAAAWGGIAFAGACYPIVIGTFFAVTYRVLYNFRMLNLDEFVSIIVFVVVAFIVGFIWAAIISVFAAAIVLAVDTTFGQILSLRAVAALCGGGTGFFAFFPVSLKIGFSDSEWWAIFLYAVLAMIMGQCGAIYSASKLEPEKYGWQRVNVNRYQFRIRHLFVATTWIAALAAVSQFDPQFRVLTGIALGIAVQSSLLLADGLWIKFQKSRQNHQSQPQSPTR